jgi:hypothetical protein
MVATKVSMGQAIAQSHPSLVGNNGGSIDRNDACFLGRELGLNPSQNLGNFGLNLQIHQYQVVCLPAQATQTAGTGTPTQINASKFHHNPRSIAEPLKSKVFTTRNRLTILKAMTGVTARFMAIKRGDFVRAVKDKLANSLEAQASDSRFPSYLFETNGEVMDISGDYALVKWGIVPTPNIWLKLDQLEAV